MKTALAAVVLAGLVAGSIWLAFGTELGNRIYCTGRIDALTPGC